ncbi:MAG: hypothetical protein O2887_16655 [Bacteroidetes bacterium]|nr:hypothetical protein [Bacteroidota bacterium]MDA1122093.1 hypothetical protein [Bacteroidota bacterium]
MALNRRDLNNGGYANYDLANINYYTNLSWRGSISDKWGVFTGMDFQVNKDDIGIGPDDFNENIKDAHFKTTFDYDHSEKVSVRFGTEYLVKNFEQRYDSQSENYTGDFSEDLISGFAEASIYTSKNFVVRPGVRAEYSQLLGQSDIAPRLPAQ